MRWFVEISQLGGKSDQDATVCVEAPQWQPALQKARAFRGDTGALGNFSIELLDDGYRAIDPMTRLRYIVRRAPDDAQLTNGAASVPPPAVTASQAPKSAAKPTEPAGKSSPATADATPMSTGPAKPEAKPAASVPSPTKAADAPKPEQKKEPAQATVAFTASGAAPAAAKPADPVPSFVVIASREENPSESSPLTYREYVYAVAPETPEQDAKRLILDRFEQVRASLATKSNRFVNLAVFDHIFNGRPQRRPVVTLAWKEWKGSEPEIFFPLRDGMSMPPSASRPSGPASAPSGPPSTSAPAPSAPTASSAKAPASTAATSTLASAEPSAKPKPDPEPKVPVVEAPSKVEPAKVEPTKAEPAKAVPAKAEPAKAEPAKAAPAKAEAPKAEAAKPEPKAEAPKAEPKAEAKPAATKAEAPKAEPKPEAKPAPKAEPVPETWPVPTVPSAAAAKPKKRLSGDDLITELFEAFGDLHFVRDALAGAEFVLHLTLEKLPSEVGIVSLFDMNTREFVVVRQSGGPRSALCMRQPEKAPLANSAMRRRHAVVVADPNEAERAMDARWRAIGVELKTLVCAPVELSGRYLGLLELANPIDGHAYNEGDGNALTYIGQQFAEFVASRGVIVDPAAIRGEEEKPSVPPPPAPKSIPKAAPSGRGSQAPASKKGR